MLRLIMMLIGLTVAGLQAQQEQQEKQESPINLSGEEQVRAFVEDYNAGDLDGMLARVSNDITWLSTAGSISQVVTHGKDELRASLQDNVEGLANRSQLVSLIQTGTTVAAVEKAFWQVRGVTRSQCSMSVYQLKAGLIDSVMYFPSDSC